MKLPIEVADLLSEINEAVQKAHYIGQDVHEHFFAANDEKKLDDQRLIVYDFDRYRVKTLIVMDAIDAIKAALQQIDELTKAA